MMHSVTELPPDFDQTQFENESWLYEANKPPVPEPGADSTTTVLGKPKFFQTLWGKLILTAGIGMVFFILILISIGLADQNRTLSPLTEPDADAVESLDLGPLGERVKTLRTQLKAADPTRELDPPPPINLELRLD